MDVAFSTSKIRKLCETRGEAERRLGSDCARKLRARLSDLEAAAVVTDLAVGRPHPLKGERHGQFSVDLSGAMRLVFEPNHLPCPRTPDGAIDWQRVTRIAVVFIGDYHD